MPETGTIKVNVKLFAHFRENRFAQREMDLAPGTTVKDTARLLGIEWTEVGVTMINSRHCPGDMRLHDGDTVAIFPMVGGG